MSEVVTLKYTGSTPGADSNTYTLFNTVSSSCPRGFGPMAKLHTYRFDIYNPQSGTVNGYFSNDRGATWTQFYTMAVTAPAAGSTNNDVILIEGYMDFKFEWVNGGAAQTNWVVHQDLSTKRAML